MRLSNASALGGSLGRGDAAPVDYVPVVRCRECKHYKPEEYECGCDFAGGLPYVKADDYCSYGEGKDYD